MATPRLKILCVDDSQQLTAALAKLIGLQSDMEAVGMLNRADHLVTEARKLCADVVLLDLTMEGHNPLAALRALNEADDKIRVIVFSGISDPDVIEEALDAGAWGFIDKAQDPQVVLDSIRRVAAGEVVLPRGHR